MSLSYVDARDVLARSQFIEESPTPLEGEPLDTQPTQIFLMPETERTQEVNNTQRLSREKRPYRRVTNGQRLELANLFRQHGDDKPAEWYSQEVGIRLARTRDLLTLLRNGKSVMPKGHYRRRSRVEPFQRLIARCLNKRPTISTRRDDVGVRVEQARGALFRDEGEKRNPHHVDRDDRCDGDGRLFPHLWVDGPRGL